MIEKHAQQKKAEKGLHGTIRGREEAGVDAAGAAMGSIGLLVFALLVWRFMSAYSPWLVLSAATVVWAIVAILIWQIRRRI